MPEPSSEARSRGDARRASNPPREPTPPIEVAVRFLGTRPRTRWEVQRRLRCAGVELAEITLHVGYGTFQPVRVERVEDHRMEPERYEIGDRAANEEL